jgi:hypothetical protein
MSSTTITITKFNGTNYAQWATEMALLLEQKHVYGIIKVYDETPVKAAEVQRGIREIIRERTIGKRRISGSVFIADSEGIPPRTA